MVKHVDIIYYFNYNQWQAPERSETLLFEYDKGFNVMALAICRLKNNYNECEVLRLKVP